MTRRRSTTEGRAAPLTEHGPSFRETCARVIIRTSKSPGDMEIIGDGRAVHIYGEAA